MDSPAGWENVPRTRRNAALYPWMRGWPPLGSRLTVTLTGGGEKTGLMGGYFDSAGGRFLVVDNYSRHFLRYEQVSGIALEESP